MQSHPDERPARSGSVPDGSADASSPQAAKANPEESPPPEPGPPEPGPLPYARRSDLAPPLVYSSPRIEVAEPGRWGDLLLIPDGGDAGPHCIKCGRPGRQTYRKTFYRGLPYLGGTALLFCFISWPTALVIVIAGLLVRRKAKIRFMLCDEHARSRRRLLIWAIALATAGAVPLLTAIRFVIGSRSVSDDGVTGMSLIAAGFFLLIIAALLVQTANTLKVHRIHQKIATLKGASRPYLDTLPDTVPPPGW